MITTSLPINPTNQRPFQKGNAARLLEASEGAGYVSNEWATFVQWKSVGRSVRKGERGTKVLLPQVIKSDEGESTSTGKIIRSYTVFNIEQTEPIENAAEVKSI